MVTGNGLKDVANAIKSAGEPIHIAPDLDLMVEEFKKRGVTVEENAVFHRKHRRTRKRDGAAVSFF